MLQMSFSVVLGSWVTSTKIIPTALSAISPQSSLSQSERLRCTFRGHCRRMSKTQWEVVGKIQHLYLLQSALCLSLLSYEVISSLFKNEEHAPWRSLFPPPPFPVQFPAHTVLRLLALLKFSEMQRSAFRFKFSENMITCTLCFGTAKYWISMFLVVVVVFL